MKTNIYFILFFAIILSACEKEEFLDRNPIDAISSNDYWKTPQDLEMYVNRFYTLFPKDSRAQNIPENVDANSDIFIGTIPDAGLAATRVVPASGGDWSWGNIRGVNYFFTHYQDVDAPWVQIKQYVGEAYFFRAYIYFTLVQKYGDVPWINKPLDSDSEELYLARTPRNIVVDSIVADLDKAISYMNIKGEVSGSRLNSQVAMLFKSRVCLFEGTWEKYHTGTPFGVTGSDGTKYLTLARDAAKQLIDGGLYDIYNQGDPSKDYYHFFGQDDYSNNPEVMLWYEYNVDLGLVHWSPSIWGLGRGVTKWLVDSYLCIDGLPISQSLLYAGDNNLIDVVTNRDPRLRQSIWVPGDPMNIIGNDTTYFLLPDIDQSGTYLCNTGYQLKKLSNRWGDNLKANYYVSEIGYIVFRYAEALLNYAEAKAELGEISQSDIDMTINKLRDRVGMPHLQLNNIASDPQWDYPTLSPIINEIRRERKVELAFEGLRLYDFLRWRSHDIIVGKRPLGAKFIQTDFPDMIIGTHVFVDVNGYLDYYQQSLPSGYGFIPDRDYLNPIPTLELTLNNNLIQNPGY